MVAFILTQSRDIEYSVRAFLRILEALRVHIDCDTHSFQMGYH